MGWQVEVKVFGFRINLGFWNEASRKTRSSPVNIGCFFQVPSAKTQNTVPSADVVTKFGNVHSSPAFFKGLGLRVWGIILPQRENLQAYWVSTCELLGAWCEGKSKDAQNLTFPIVAQHQVIMEKKLETIGF